VAQFRQRLNVRPEGFDLVEALQIELMNDDIAVPTPSVNGARAAVRNGFSNLDVAPWNNPFGIDFM